MNKSSVSEISVRDLQQIIRRQILGGFCSDFAHRISSLKRKNNIRSSDLSVKDGNAAANLSADAFFLPGIVVVSLKAFVSGNSDNTHMIVKLPWYRYLFFRPEQKKISFFFATDPETLKATHQKLHDITSLQSGLTDSYNDNTTNVDSPADLNADSAQPATVDSESADLYQLLVESEFTALSPEVSLPPENIKPENTDPENNALNKTAVQNTSASVEVQALLNLLLQNSKILSLRRVYVGFERISPAKFR